MTDLSIAVWQHQGKVILHQTMVEDGLDMSSDVEIYQEHVAWVRESLAVLTENWHAQELQHQLLDEKIEIFSAGSEMDPMVGIQNERSGKSFSMIVRLSLARKLVQLLSSSIPNASVCLHRPEQLEKKTEQPSDAAQQPQVRINTIECRDPLGDLAETVEISCGDARYWNWSQDKLFNQLKKIQSRLAAQKSDKRKSEILLEEESCLLPGKNVSEKEQTLSRMVLQLERLMKSRKR